ncbi:MAG TPA: hypothetical protein VFH47_09385 [Candidatus Thermoplasmatota archaeon]|nr:hypothetical protein [Candidatus Thermoplasmatota archaeon]
MAKRSLHQVHEEIGPTGRFGEVFIALAVLIGIVGILFLAWTQTSYFEESPVGQHAAEGDMQILGYWYVVMGIGFGVFGAMVMLSGWARHHPDSEA